MWSKIINPETGRSVNINGLMGRKVLNNFIVESQLGGSVCGLDKKTKRCNRKSVGIDGDLCELGKRNRCQKKKTKKKKGRLSGKQVTENMIKRSKLTSRHRRKEAKRGGADRADADDEVWGKTGVGNRRANDKVWEQVSDDDVQKWMRGGGTAAERIAQLFDAPRPPSYPPPPLPRGSQTPHGQSSASQGYSSARRACCFPSARRATAAAPLSPTRGGRPRPPR